MPWEHGAARSCSYCHICCGRASVVILLMYVVCIWRCSLVHVSLFWGDADILITCDWVMVISGPYISVSISVSVYFNLGYDVPACGSRVPFVYICVCLITVSIHIIVVVVGYLWLEFRLVIFILLYIRIDWWLGLAGSRHWSTYMYWFLVSYHSAPRPYIRTGWSVVRQIDGPCQFFCRNYNLILKLK